MLKWSLIVPNTRYGTYGLWSILPSRGLLSLAACLRKNGCDVNYIDADFENLSSEEVIARLSCYGSNVVGITMNTFQVKSGIELAKSIKLYDPHIKIIFGGPHPSALPSQTLIDCPEAAVVCIGESEETVVELTKTIENKLDLANVMGISYRVSDKICNNTARPSIKDLDSIPIPAYDLAGDIKRYPGAQPVLKPPSMHIMASRGCPFSCIFCTKSVWGNTVRFRSPEKIVDEVEFLHSKHGINEIFFQDDTMNINRKWFFKVCDEIIKRELNKKLVFKTSFRVNRHLVDSELLQKAKTAGFWMVFYGVESGNQKVLDIVKKGTTIEEIKRAFLLTHKAGMKTIAAFMIGNVGDTVETVNDSIELAKELKSEVSGFSPATPLPGTKFYEIAKKKGWITCNDFSKWSQSMAVCRNDTLTAEQITQLRDKAYEEVPDCMRRKSVISQLKKKVKKIPVIGLLLSILWKAMKDLFRYVKIKRACLPHGQIVIFFV